MASLSSVPSPPNSDANPDAPDATVHLRILATSDLHAHLMPWDYMTDRPSPTGLAHLAPMIRAARDGAANCLLFDNGDFLQGSPLGDWAEAQGPDAPHPMVLAMNALGYDAATLGNHEFSHGLPFLEGALAGARFPVVCANLTRSDATPLVPDHIILDRTVTATDGGTHALRIAITGFAPPQTPLWEALKLRQTIRSADILHAAQTTLPRVALARPDLTIALAHTGIGADQPEPEMENAALPLAALPQIDVIVAGHTHLVFPDPDVLQGNPVNHRQSATLHGKPAVMPGFYGSHLGVIDLTLHRHAGRWRILHHHARARPAPPDPDPDPQLALLAEPAHRATLAAMRRPVGHTARALHTHFALVAPSAARCLVAQAQAAHLRPLVPKHLAHLPLLSAVALFRTGGRGGPANFSDIPAGPLQARHIADLYLHPNTPVLLHLSGAELADWLERAAILFTQITPGSIDTPLIRCDVPGFDFDMIDGLSFRIDLSHPPRFDTRGRLIAPKARRITGLAHKGRVVQPTDAFLLATNSYRAGGGSFPGTARPPVASSDTPISIVLANHVAASATVDPAPANAWGFCAMPATSVLLDTAPQALAHVADIARFRPEPLGLTASGFLRFRLHL